MRSSQMPVIPVTAGSGGRFHRYRRARQSFITIPRTWVEMPEFTRSLDGSKPKVTSGGWAKESTVHQLPIMTGLAGVHMFLNPGASRELHWHAIAAEWAYVIGGRCQTVVLDPSGQTEINNY